MNELVSQSGKKMMVGLCFRYHDGLRKAKKFLEDGRIGRLVSVRALMGEHLPLSDLIIRAFFHPCIQVLLTSCTT